MSFWKRNKPTPSPADAGRVQKAKKTIKRSPPVAMEVKILALEALDSGLSAIEVGELVGVGSGTIHKWREDYADGGVQGLCRKASSTRGKASTGFLPDGPMEPAIPVLESTQKAVGARVCLPPQKG